MSEQKQTSPLIPLFALFVILAILAGMCPCSFSCSKERARRSKCTANLSQIGKALKMCSMDHADRFPATFLELTNYVGSFPKLFICPSSDHRVGAMTNVNEWTDYAYVSGLTEADPSDGVSAFCPPENHDGDGGNVLFVDGSVQWVAASDLVAMTSSPALFFGTTNEVALADLQKRTKIIRGTKQIGKK